MKQKDDKAGGSAAKQLARKKARAGRQALAERTDYVGRKGMGESSDSYVKDDPKGDPGYSSRAYMNSEARNSIGRMNNVRNDATVPGAEAYARKRRQEMNPRRDDSGRGNAGFGRSK